MVETTVSFTCLSISAGSKLVVEVGGVDGGGTEEDGSGA